MKKTLFFMLSVLGYVAHGRVYSERFPEIIGYGVQFPPEPPSRIDFPCEFNIKSYERMWKAALVDSLARLRYDRKGGIYLYNYEKSLLSSLEYHKKVINERLDACKERHKIAKIMAEADGYSYAWN